jgi:hypothetical protein
MNNVTRNVCQTGTHLPEYGLNYATASIPEFYRTFKCNSTPNTGTFQCTLKRRDTGIFFKEHRMHAQLHLQIQYVAGFPHSMHKFRYVLRRFSYGDSAAESTGCIFSTRVHTHTFVALCQSSIPLCLFLVDKL